MRWNRGFFIEAVVSSTCSITLVGIDVWRAIGCEATGVPFVGVFATPLRAFRSQSALPNAGGAVIDGGNGGMGVAGTGVGCETGAAAAGLLN